YPWCPLFEPDQMIPSTLLARMAPTAQGVEPLLNVSALPYPFNNMSIYWLMSWMNSSGSLFSETKVLHLVKDVILAEDFNPKDLDNFSVRQNLQQLDRDASGKGITSDDWIQTSITISIPSKSRQDGPQPYNVPGFHYCSLVNVIHATFSDAQGKVFHLLPFQWLWKDPLDGHQEQVYNELYTSNAWLEAQDNIQKLPKEPGCSLECIIAGLMFFSNATHLANFGMAKAWLLYLYFRNLTKYA
ncbi:hypothetical protein BDR04DRAFT_1023759, partial [Suillus decipiens]